MGKYIIIWNNSKEEYECNNMSEAEEYANNKNITTNKWSIITLIND
jgi:hypothetical protein